jgi:hypothetical protein
LKQCLDLFARDTVLLAFRDIAFIPVEADNLLAYPGNVCVRLYKRNATDSVDRSVLIAPDAFA